MPAKVNNLPEENLGEPEEPVSGLGEPEENEGETDTGSSEEPVEESEESFMGEGFNPDSLKPELQKAYKQMQAQWTKKNQSLSSERQEAAKLRQWKEQLESNPYFQQWAREMENAAKAEQQRNLAYMPEEERIAYLVDQKLNQILETKISPRVANLEADRAYARVEKFLAENPEAKNYTKNMVAIMKAHPTLSMEDSWKLVKASFAKENAKKEVMQEISLKERANLELPGKQASLPAGKKGMSVEEALELAERQTGIKL